MNPYKIYCNCYYTPMARSLTDYILNPLFNIYYFIRGEDFQSNFLYFFIFEIICLFADFFCCVYNEFIIVTFCGLAYDTKEEISKRAIETEMNPLNIEDDDDDKNNE